MNDEQVNLYEDYAKVLKATFKTKHGKELLEYFKKHIVDPPALRSDAISTYYQLGKKEFVQGLIAEIEDPNLLDKLKVMRTGATNE